MKRLTSAMLAMVMAAMSIMTAFAEGAVTIPEIESGYTITYPEPANLSSLNVDDTAIQSSEDNECDYSFKMMNIVHKQDEYDVSFLKYYNDTYNMAAETILSYYFSEDEMAALYINNEKYDCDIMFKLLVCFLENDNVSDSDKCAAMDIINGRAEIYYALKLYTQWLELDDETKIQLDNSLSAFYEFMKNQPQTYSTSYEMDIESLVIKNEYYNKSGKNLYINDVSGNLRYSRNDFSIPIKNGLKMELPIVYDLQDAYFAFYNPQSDVMPCNPLGCGWWFGITRKKGNTITLSDGQMIILENNKIKYSTRKDVQYLYDNSVNCYYLLYLDGTREYFLNSNMSTGVTQYIRKKQDKYGNSIIYLTDENDSEKITQVISPQSDVTINIAYYDEETYVRCSAGGIVTRYVKTAATYSYGPNNRYSDQTYIMDEVLDAQGNQMASFEYDVLDYCVYEGTSSGSVETDYKAFTGMSCINEGPGGECYSIGYCSKTGNPWTYYEPAVHTYKLNNNETSLPMKTYTYKARDYFSAWKEETDFITIDYIDGKQEQIREGRKCMTRGIYKPSDDNDEYVLIYCTETTYHNQQPSVPERIVTKMYDNGQYSYLKNQYEYEYNDKYQVTRCERRVDESYIDEVIYTYKNDAYSSLDSIEILDNDTMLQYITYDINSYGDVEAEFVYDYNYDGVVRKTDYIYDSKHNLIGKTVSKDSNGAVLYSETMEYSDKYNNAVMTKFTDGAGHVTEYDYNAILQPISITDGRGNVEQLQYDAYGNVKKITHPDNSYRNITYYMCDSSIDVTDENGYLYTYWMQNGQTIKVTEGIDYTDVLTTAQLDDFGRPISSTDALGNTTTAEYDLYGRQNKVTYPAIGTNVAGSVQVKYYDGFYEDSTTYQMKMIISQENAVSLEYFDVRGRLVKTAMVNNPSTLLSKADIDTMISLPTDTQLIVTGTYTYDDWDRLIQTADGMGRTTSYTYDIFDNVLCVTQGDGSQIYTIYYEYDAAGNLTKMTQGTHVTTYEYNLAGQLTKVTDPMGYTETYTYDAAGNVATYKDKNGVTTAYTYDNRNRLIKQTKGAKSIEYTYDSVGNVLTQKNENGTIKLEYNTDGTLKKKTMPDGKSISYTYDDAKKVATMTDYFGAKTTYTYTGGNYISKIDTAHGEVGYYYRKDGKLTDQYGEYNETLYTYDSLGRVNYMWLGNAGVIGYAYDNSGNVISKVDTGTNITTNYVYDDVNRLIQEKPGNQTYYYTYDKYNNLTYRILGNTDKMYSYDANNRITTSTVYGDPTKDIIYDYFSEYEYDKNGNLITEERRYDAMKKGTYELIASDTEYDDRGYDVWGNLTYTHDEDVANGVITYSNMTYYADGMRKSKQSNMRQSGVTTNTTYNYYYHGDTVINETRTASGTTSNYATNIIGVTGIEARKQNGTTGFFAKDLHGDVRGAYTSTGTELANYVYGSWGDVTDSSTSTWAKDNPLRYNGQYYDQETEMYYLRARYYDPNMNRFISEDPIKDGINWYAYAGNNPVMFVDPSGLFGQNTVLKNGMYNNPDVVKLQQTLCELGYIEQKYITGNFYSITENAVRSFQEDNNLHVDGKVGINTWKALGLNIDNDIEATYYAAGGQKNIKAKAVYAEIDAFELWSIEPNLLSGQAAFSEITVFSDNKNISYDLNTLVVDGELGNKSGGNIALFKGTVTVQVEIPFTDLELEAEINGYAFGIGKDIKGGFGSSYNIKVQ